MKTIHFEVFDSLRYISKKYENKFGKTITISYDEDGFDYNTICRLWMMLGAKKQDGKLVKSYIDWFFNNYNKNKRFTSVGAFTNQHLIYNFRSESPLLSSPKRK